MSILLTTEFTVCHWVVDKKKKIMDYTHKLSTVELLLNRCVFLVDKQLKQRGRFHLESRES